MNYSEKALSRIYWQYKNSPKLKALVDILPSLGQVNFEDPAQIIANILDIGNRTGHQLDIIGRIVGLSRPPVNRQAEVAGVIAFGPSDDLALQFGSGGAQFSDAEQTISESASDNLFRVLIKARIERNNGDATIDNIIRAARFVAGINLVTVSDNQDMSWSVSFGENLDSTTRFAFRNFDILPRPQGTRFLGFIESPTLTQFGVDFAQFGDETAQFNEVFI